MAKKPAASSASVAVAPAKGGRGGGRRGPSRGTAYTAGAAKNRHLVIVESP